MPFCYMTYRILAINPGSTSTKIAVFDNDKPIYTKTFAHTPDDLAPFNKPADQYEWRRDMIIKDLRNNGIKLDTLDAVIGRGGILRPVESGVYSVNDAMIHDLQHATRQHASNLGGLIARYIADLVGKPSFIADPVVVDEMIPYARITGVPELPRESVFHALNQKAVARLYAKENEMRYEDLNLIVCHMGGGITISAHRNGKVIDTTNALNGCGPFSPERSGTLPPGPLIDLCFSGKYTHAELINLVHGKGGLRAHLGTTSIPEILDRVDHGDLHAMLIIRAMCYSIAKEIGAMAIALRGNIDAILLTGGVAHSKRITDYIAGHCNFIAPIYVYPGENELRALANNALGVLNGELKTNTYEPAPKDDPANVNDVSRPSKIREWLTAARFTNFSTKRKLSAMRQYMRSWSRRFSSDD